MTNCINHPERLAKTKGLCQACYMRAYRNGGITPETPPKEYGQIPECHPNQPYRANGLCVNCYQKRYYELHKGQTKFYRRINECGHPERKHAAHGMCNNCYHAQDRQYRQDYAKSHGRAAILKHRYNLTIEEWDALNKKQNGLCAICGKPPRGNCTRLFVDHDHITGKNRGLLCITCNRTLGYLENTEWKARAEAYLAAHK